MGDSQNTSLIIGLSVGLGLAIVIAIAIALVLVFCRKKIKCLNTSEPEKAIENHNYMYVKAENEVKHVPEMGDTGEGMVDNILYEPMGDMPYSEVRSKPNGDGTVYTDVEVVPDNTKRDRQSSMKIHEDSSRAVYSEVTATVRPEPDYAEVNKSHRRPPLPPKT